MHNLEKHPLEDDNVIEVNTITNPYGKATFKEKLLNGLSWTANSVIGGFCCDFILPAAVGITAFAFTAGPKLYDRMQDKIEALKEKAETEYATNQTVTFVEMDKGTKMTDNAGMVNSVIVFTDLEKAKAHITEKTDMNGVNPPWWTVGVGIATFLAAGAGMVYGRRKLEDAADQMTEDRWIKQSQWEANPS